MLRLAIAPSIQRPACVCAELHRLYRGSPQCGVVRTEPGEESENSPKRACRLFYASCLVFLCQIDHSMPEELQKGILEAIQGHKSNSQNLGSWPWRDLEWPLCPRMRSDRKQ